MSGMTHRGGVRNNFFFSHRVKAPSGPGSNRDSRSVMGGHVACLIGQLTLLACGLLALVERQSIVETDSPATCDVLGLQKRGWDVLP
jgi:hypothetical protein